MDMSLGQTQARKSVSGMVFALHSLYENHLALKLDKRDLTGDIFDIRVPQNGAVKFRPLREVVRGRSSDAELHCAA